MVGMGFPSCSGGRPLHFDGVEVFYGDRRKVVRCGFGVLHKPTGHAFRHAEVHVGGIIEVKWFHYIPVPRVVYFWIIFSYVHAVPESPPGQLTSLAN